MIIEVLSEVKGALIISIHFGERNSVQQSLLCEERTANLRLCHVARA